MTVALSSPSGQTGTLVQAGVINSSGQLNVTATIATNIPSRYTVVIGSGGSSVANVTTPGNLTNAGTLTLGFEATMTVNGTFTNTGTVTVPASGFTTTLVATSSTNNKSFTVNAPLNLNLASGGTFTNGVNGKLTLVKGALAVAGPVVKDGSGTIDSKDTFNVNNNGATPSNYTQASTGTLVLPAAKVLGLLNVTGTASLAGGVNLSPTGSFLPAFGAAPTFINDAATSGTITTVTGPYTISYSATKVQAIGHATPPSVVLTPTSGAAGSTVKVTGGGYKGGETVNVYLDSTAGTPLATPKATSSGTISVNVTIPAGTPAGGHPVITVGQTSGQSGSATFTVT